MRKLARLALCFSLCFAASFVLLALFRFLGLWVEAAALIVPGSGAAPRPAGWAAALGDALPATVYVAVLLCLSYASRKNLPVPLSQIAVGVLALAFTTALALGTRHVAAAGGASAISPRPGLILEQRGGAVVLLTGNAAGPRVDAVSGGPLTYENADSGAGDQSLERAVLVFGTGTPWFIRGVTDDLGRAARAFTTRLDAGPVPFCVYAGTLIFLLTSFRFLLDLSAWPLANLFLGAVVFRGVLALESFLEGPVVRDFVAARFAGRGPAVPLAEAAAPLAFTALGLLVCLYTFLAFVARGGRARDA